MNIPSGWKLVPVKPTDEMLAIYKHFYRRGEGYLDLSVWKGMLDAAPHPPPGVAVLDLSGPQLCPGCRLPLLPEGAKSSGPLHSDNNGTPWHTPCLEATGFKICTRSPR